MIIMYIQNFVLNLMDKSELQKFKIIQNFQVILIFFNIHYTYLHNIIKY